MLQRGILITGVGGDIGQGIIKCIKNMEYAFDVIGCDTDCYAAGRREVRIFFESPPVRENQKYLEFIKKIVNAEHINYIIPTTEAEIEFYSRFRDYFNEVRLIVNSSFIIDTFLDKYKTTNFLKSNGLPYPKTYLIEDYNNELSFPMLLKKRKGYGGKGSVIINDNEELNFYKTKIKDVVIQEIAGTPDEEYTVGVFSTGKDVYSIAFKRVLGYGSLSKIAQLIYDEEIKDLAERIAKASSLEGSFNIQLRKTNKCYVPFEINPRFSSTVYTRHCFGFQDVKWWMDLKEGQEIKYIPKYKRGIAVRALGETFFDLVPL